MAPELVQLEKTVGQFMVYWGFKSIHGRIWLHLYLSTEPLDSAELMERLLVSKGLMSTALRQLLKYKVIRAIGTGPHGTVYYEANPNLQDVIAGVLRSREKVLLKKAKDGCLKISKLNKQQLKDLHLSKERIESVKSLTTSAELVLDGFLSLSPSRENFDFQNLIRLSTKNSEW